ncbi:MAG: guanylate kinase [Acidimicrobiales bacterium]
MLIGPGGAGKGTVSRALVAHDPTLWLSRSWTTRPARPGEDGDAYVYVDTDAFMAHVHENGFLEWAEFLGHLYGTPIPDPPAGSDVLLEIDVQGAQQVVHKCPGSVVILLMPPSLEVQEQRLEARGDPADQVTLRIEKGRDEVRQAHALAAHEVVNDDVARATTQVAGIIEASRSARFEHS